MRQIVNIITLLFFIPGLALAGGAGNSIYHVEPSEESVSIYSRSYLGASSDVVSAKMMKLAYMGGYISDETKSAVAIG